MRGCLVLLTTLWVALALKEYRDPQDSFNSEITKLYVSSKKTKLVMEVQQEVPLNHRYEAKYIPEQYKISIECLNTRIPAVRVWDVVHPVFRMDEDKPFPNIHNLHQRKQDEWEQFTEVKADRPISLEYCNTTVTIKPISIYVEIEIDHFGNLIKLTGFRVQKKFLVFHLNVRADFLMGLGERNGKFKIDQGKYTIWSKDNLFAVQKKGPCQHTYGYHPVAIYRDTVTKRYEMFYIRSTGAIEMTIETNSFGKWLLTELHGNSAEIILFHNQSALEVNKAYHEYVGGYKIPPLWYFGFHQSRWGYKDINMVEAIVSGYQSSKLKLESVFLDIDYMVDKKPFRIDSKNFPMDRLARLKKELGIKIVPIVDFAFNFDFQSDLTQKLKKLYGEQDTALKNYFIKDHLGNLCIGQVWPGISIFPDFYHPKIQHFWQPYLDHLKNNIPYDSFWLDMNEVANFHHTIRENNDNANTYLRCGEHLSNMTLPMSSTHYNSWTEFEMHNINGIKQQQISSEIGNRIINPDFFFISRNTFPGSGQYCGHWSGDNQAKQEYIEYSLSSLLNFNIFGIPFTGSDICGFYGDYVEDLCSKWIQSNTLFPFFRNHNHIEATDQEFYKVGQHIEMSILNAMNLRYSIIKYLHNLFVQSDGTGLIYYPLHFAFSEDYELLVSDTVISTHCMIGQYLLFSIGEYVYFPISSNWYNFNDGDPIAQAYSESRLLHQDDAPYYEQSVFVKEGALILKQHSQNALRIEDLGNIYIIDCYLNQDNECSIVYHDHDTRNKSLYEGHKVSSRMVSYEIKIKMQWGVSNIAVLTMNNVAQEHLKQFKIKFSSIYIHSMSKIIEKDWGCIMQSTRLSSHQYVCVREQQSDYQFQLIPTVLLPYELTSGETVIFQMIEGSPLQNQQETQL